MRKIVQIAVAETPETTGAPASTTVIATDEDGRAWVICRTWGAGSGWGSWEPLPPLPEKEPGHDR